MEIMNTDLDLSNRPLFQQFQRTRKRNRPATGDDCLPWTVDGFALPHGTKMRGQYKGYTYQGRVHNGVFMLHGKEFMSPCAAAVTITRNPVDGWLFWDCQLPDQSDWVSIFELKNS